MTLAFLVALLACNPGAATPSDPFDSLQPYLIGIGVANAETSAKWYEEVLGFKTFRRMDLPDYGLKIAFLERGSFRLELVEKKGAAALSHYAPDLQDDMVNGLKKYAFLIRDLDAAAAKLKAKNVRFVVEPFDDQAMRLRSFIVADPDGNLVQFIQELDGASK